MNEAIHKALAVFRQFPDASHEDTVAQLTVAVADADLAERLMEFVPIAFARIALASSGVSFQDTFCRSLGNGKFSHFCPLSADPIYEPALAIAREELGSAIPEPDLLAVLTRSGQFDAINKALLAGTQLKGAVMSPSIFLRSAPMPCEPPKPWWKLW